jgi:DNA-binding MarR family transcriptional regulator
MAIGMERREDISDLETHLGYWLRFVSNHVSHGFKLKLAARDVTVAEWVLMRELYGNAPTRPSDIAASLGMTRGAISKLTDRLAAKGLMVRSAGGSDRRTQALALTASGRALVPKLAALADKNDAEFFGHLPKATRATLMRAMREIVRPHTLRGAPID